jgi:hypothetical protein
LSRNGLWLILARKPTKSLQPEVELLQQWNYGLTDKIKVKR